MPSDRARFALEEIRDNIRLAESFVAGMDLAGFESDVRTHYAVICCLAIISEASRRLGDEVRARHRGLDWPSIATAGNIYRHEYNAVRLETVWITVQAALPRLRDVVEAELGREA